MRVAHKWLLGRAALGGQSMTVCVGVVAMSVQETRSDKRLHWSTLPWKF